MLTQASFVASKIMAWVDRASSRDLFDLWLLARADAIDRSAAQLFARYGQTGKPPTGDLFASAPEETRWHQELSGQDPPRRHGS